MPLKPRQGNRGQQQQASLRPIPAPFGGWNQRDALANMKEYDAVLLTNWFPEATQIVTRKGSLDWATNIGSTEVESGVFEDQVETIIKYAPPSGAHQQFTIAGGSVFNGTGSGDVDSAILTGLSNSRWEYINFTTAGGNFVLAVNGADNALLFDGTDWTVITGVSSPAITGVDTDDLIHLQVFQNRVWAVETASLSVWYSAVGAITGAYTELPLGSVFQKGGSLVAMGAWTVDTDAGGLNDLAVFITDQGEAAVYQGTDPGNADTWFLLGVFNIGAPVGHRFMEKVGSDLFILTTNGIIPMSGVISGSSAKELSLSDKISGAVDRAIELYKSNFGWELKYFAAGTMLILNVPVAPNVQEQYVMNMTTKAWTRFTGWPANTFCILNDELYFGMLGKTRKAWTTSADNGQLIVCRVVPAFSYYGSRGNLKQFQQFQPVLSRTGNPNVIRLGFNVDYEISEPTQIVTLPVISSGATWDEALWDEAIWGGQSSAESQWYDLGEIGVAGAPDFEVSTNFSVVRVAAFNVTFTPGGIL